MRLCICKNFTCTVCEGCELWIKHPEPSQWLETLLVLMQPPPRSLSMWRSNCNKLSLSGIHCGKDADSSGTPRARLEPELLWSARRFVHRATVMNLPRTRMESLNTLRKAAWWGRSQTLDVREDSLLLLLSYVSSVSLLFKLLPALFTSFSFLFQRCNIHGIIFSAIPDVLI